MNAKEAREIIDQFKNSTLLGFNEIHPNAKAYFMAEGYLMGRSDMKKEMVEKMKPFIKALEKAMEERILNHPNVEAAAMEDLEVELEKYRRIGSGE